MPSFFTEEQFQKALHHMQNLDLSELATLKSKYGWEPPPPDADPATIEKAWALLGIARHKMQRARGPTSDPITRGLEQESDLRKFFKDRREELVERARGQQQQPLSNPSSELVEKLPVPENVPDDIKSVNINKINDEIDRILLQLNGVKGEVKPEHDKSVIGRLKYLRHQLKKPGLTSTSYDKIQEEIEVLSDKRKELTVRLEQLKDRKKMYTMANRPKPGEQPATPSAPAPQQQAVPAFPMPPSTVPDPPQRSQAPAPPPAAPPSAAPQQTSAPPPAAQPPAAPQQTKPSTDPLQPKPLSQRKTIKDKQYPMADKDKAAEALSQIVGRINLNPAYVATYPIFEDLLKKVQADTPNMYTVVPKLRDAFRYMKEQHPRLYKQISGLYPNIEDGISPPKAPKPDLFQRIREFLDPDEPEPHEIPKRVFRSHKSYSMSEIAKAIEAYIKELESDGYPDVDVKLAVLRQFGPGVYNAVYDDDVVVSGRVVNANSFHTASLSSTRCKILKVDSDLNVHFKVGSSYYIGLADDLEFEAIGD